MQPPGYGKSSLASRLFVPAGMAVVSGDQQLSLVVEGKLAAPEPLRGTISEDYSPFCNDKTIERIFENGLGGELVKTWAGQDGEQSSEDHTSELQSLMRISYAVFCLKKKIKT